MTLKSAQIPVPLARSWRVGVRLRFKLDAAVKPYYRYLRGTPVLVLSGLTFKEEANDWRQYVSAFGARYPDEPFGWALPEQLEPFPGDSDDPGLQVGAESETGSGSNGIGVGAGTPTPAGTVGNCHAHR